MSKFVCFAFVVLAVVFMTPGTTASIVSGDSPAIMHNVAARIAEINGVQQADATAQIAGSLFDKVIGEIIPVVNTFATHFTIPGEKTKHFSFNSFKLSEFHIGSVTVSFQGPNKVVLSVNDLSLAVPQTGFDVYTRIIFKISCGGHFWASLGSTSMKVTLDVSTNNSTGNLVFTPSGSSVQFGALNIDHKFNHFLCKVGQDIVQLFIGNIDNKIKSLVEKEIPQKLGSGVAGALDRVFTRVPMAFVGEPTIANNAIRVTVNLLESKKRYMDEPQELDFEDGQWRDSTFKGEKAMSPHDLELFIGEQSLDTLLSVYTAEGKLDKNMLIPADKLNTTSLKPIIPAAYKACPNCPMAVQTGFVHSPPAVVLGNQSVDILVHNMILGLTAVTGPVKTDTKALFELSVNVSASLVNLGVFPGPNATSIIKFNLTIADFQMGLYKSAIGNVDIKDFSPIVGFILEGFLVPAFNSNFKGVSLPAVLNNVVIDVNAQTFGLGLDIQLPPLFGRH